MARDVDRIIDYINEQTYIPPVMRQVMVNRIDPPPNQEEINRAKEQLYPNNSTDPWRAKDETKTVPTIP